MTFTFDQYKTFLRKSHINIMKKVGEIADSIGEQCFVVGGIVRDCLIGQISDDLDFVCTDIDKVANKIIEKNPRFVNDITKQKMGSKNIGEKTTSSYRTRIVIFGNEKIDFVEPRKETYTKDSIKPKVTKGTLKDDDLRRDFTLNTLKLGVGKKDWLKIYDSTGRGLKDLENKILDTPINPDITFQQDPTRMLRGVRFSACKDMTLTHKLVNSIRKNKKEIKRVPFELIHKEFMKGGGCNNFYKIMDHVHLLEEIIPEVTALKVVQQNPTWHKFDAFNHTMGVVDNLPNDPLLRLGGLLHDIGKLETTDNELHTYNHANVGSEQTKNILKRLKYSKKDTTKISRLVKSHMLLHTFTNHTITKKGKRRFLQKNTDIFPDLIQMTRADILSDNPNADYEIIKLEKVIEDLREIQLEMNTLLENKFTLEINGKDIMQMGYKGKDIGTIKDHVSQMVIDGNLQNNRKILLQYTKENAKGLL